MEGLTSHAPMTVLLRERGTFERHPFVLIDVGCAGGIVDLWRVFGPSLVARGYDPDVAVCEDAQSREPFADVRYQARYVGLPETHPFVQQRRAEAAQWPNADIWGRVTAGYVAQRAAESATPGPPRATADPATILGVDDIVRDEKLPTLDFLKIDVDGPDLEVLESAREVLSNGQVLGVGMEVNWFGTPNPTEHTFHNTDRFLREHGFTLFGTELRRYSRVDLPAPFETELRAHTRWGQPYQGDAIYLRDLAADYLAAEAANYPPDKLIKLACLYELACLPDCAAEILNHFEARLTEFGDLEPLRDALTPSLPGEQLSYRAYVARFQRDPRDFPPGTVTHPGLPPSDHSLPDVAARRRIASVPAVVRDIADRIRQQQVTNRLDGMRRMDHADLAPRLRLAFLNRAPRAVVHAVATALARARPLRLDPGWRWHFPGDEESELTLLRRDLWTYYRDNRIETPVVFRWYDGLRLRLYLGNDLSVSLFVLGAFEPNEFVFLNRVLEPGMVVLDGGANEGIYSVYAGRRVGRRGAVLAVEPSTREFARLETNLALNRLDNVRTFNLALGSHVGEAVLAVAEPRHAGLNAINLAGVSDGGEAWTESHESVAIDTIDEIVTRSKLTRLDLVKLDVEGSEVDALAGARDAVSRFRPTILLEVEDARLASQGRSRQDLLDAVAEIGYELWVFDEHSAQLRPADLPAEPEGNAIAAPRGWQPPRLG